MSAIRSLPAPTRGKYRERWAVDSDEMSEEYTVARDGYGNFGCSCPAWKFHRAPKPDCKHIEAVRVYLRTPLRARTIVPDQVVGGTESVPQGSRRLLPKPDDR